jgi:primosomal protein N''
MNILETLQKIAATTERLDMALAEIERERAERQRFEDATTARMERLEAQLSEMRERLARLETAREADRSQMAAELARFKAEVERAELRLTRLLPAQSETPALPECEKET